jgi:probable HAF family extracellular repeat protein
MDEFTIDDLRRRSRRREDAAAQCWALARKLVLSLSLVLACQSVLAQAMYRIKPLGYLGGCTSSAPVVHGFNTADQVTGTACNAHGDMHAFLWKNNGSPMVDLGPDEVGSTSSGNALNASGLVAGSAQDSTGSFAFVSSGGGTPMSRIYDSLGGSYAEALAINDLGQLTGDAQALGEPHAFIWRNDGSPMLDLGTLSVEYGYDYSYGNAINASGQVAGYAGLSDEPVSGAFSWDKYGTLLLDLGSYLSSAQLINASGQVAGVIAVSPGSRAHAFLWKNDGTPIHDLGTLGGAQAVPYALNDSGQIAGWSDTLRFLKPHAFVWLNNGTPMKDLGTFGGTTSQANDINAAGQATGYAFLTGDALSHAFLWRNDGSTTQDLNALIDPTDPLKPYVTLTSGAFINDIGDIAAEGTDSRTGQSGPYLLQGTVLTLTPRSLAFGSQPIHTSSAARSVTMTNTSSRTVAITNIALTGSATGQFASTNNCGHSLAGHATCAIKVTFNPTSTGAKSESLNVNGGGGGLRTVNLTGTGTGP